MFFYLFVLFCSVYTVDFPIIGHLLKVREVLANEKFPPLKKYPRRLLQENKKSRCSATIFWLCTYFVRTYTSNIVTSMLHPFLFPVGNNLYDEEMIQELQRVSDKPEERSQYILMERIRPPVVQNYLIHHDMKKGTPDLDETIAELGIFGVHIRYVCVFLSLFHKMIVLIRFCSTPMKACLIFTVFHLSTYH